MVGTATYLYVVYILNVYRAALDLVGERLRARTAVAMIRGRA
ncbi:MAG: hypothetical protein ACE5HM_05025 [Acidiferrobacterales bacterium]